MPTKINLMKLGLYQHYKGGFYEVIGVALHSETLEDLVVYRSTSREDNFALYTRPKQMFEEVVTHNLIERPRFLFIQELNTETPRSSKTDG